MFVVLWELAEILWTLGKNGPLYSLLSAYKGAHKISSIYWVYGLYKGFIKLYQKLSISLMHMSRLLIYTSYSASYTVLTQTTTFSKRIHK
jgi:hypothetical protein